MEFKKKKKKSNVQSTSQRASDVSEITVGMKGKTKADKENGVKSHQVLLDHEAALIK